MTLLELLATVLLIGIAAGGVLLLVVVIRRSPGSATGDLVDRGDFTAALDGADTGAAAGRDELLAAAVAAKHLLELERAEELLARIVGADPGDGEAWLERGLVLGYRGAAEEALAHLARAAGLRADLSEPIALHTAWISLQAGDESRARRIFEEIEAPLESKLESDLGPGDPPFGEWFLQAADLWQLTGRTHKSAWARAAARRAAPGSALVSRYAGETEA